MDWTNLYSIVLMIVGIGVIIFVHELGHYLVAKWADVKVEAFSLGFGPALFQRRIGETVYKLCAIPLGGYVKMTGETPGGPPSDDPREFGAKSVGVRAAIISAGVVMNLLLACVAFPVVFSLGVRMDAPDVGSVVKGTPAWSQGLESGDRVVAVDGAAVRSFDHLLFEIALSDGPLRLEVERAGRRTTVEVAAEYDGDIGVPRIGVRPATELWVTPRGRGPVAGLDGPAKVLRLNGIEGTDADRIRELVDGVSARKPVDMELVVERAGAATTLRFEARMVPTEGWFLGIQFPGAATVRAVRAVGPFLDLRAGDRIVSVAGRPVNNEVAVLESVLAAPAGPVAMHVARGAAPEKVEPIEVAALADPATRRAVMENLAFEDGSGGTVVVPIEGEAAAAAGFEVSDRIVAVDGEKVTSGAELRNRIERFDPARQPQGLVFEVERTVFEDGAPVVRTVTLAASPAPRQRNDALAEVQLGHAPVQTDVRFPFPASIWQGLRYTKIWTFNTLKTLERIVTGRVSAKTLGGIITIGKVTYDFAEKGFINLLYFLAILSVNLAIINLLPIPVLDGGHLLFLAIEKIKGSPVSERVVGVGQAIGLVLLLALIVFVTFNDIQRWFLS